MDCRLQAPLSLGFPRQEYQSGFPFLSPGDLPDPAIELVPPALASGFFTTGEALGNFFYPTVDQWRTQDVVEILLELKVFRLLPPGSQNTTGKESQLLPPLSSSSAEMTDVKVFSNHNSQQCFSFLQPYS